MSSARYRKGDEAVISRLPPPKHERGFGAFMWNPRTRAVMGRTACSWAMIGLFYIVFYLCLATFFTIMMFVFYQTLDDNFPKYTGQDSLLTNPGLSFRPRTFYINDLKPTIEYSPSSSWAGLHLSQSIDQFLEPYHSGLFDNQRIECQPGDGFRESGFPVCHFEMPLNTSCSREDNWGYKTHSPCIILRLNKMFDWTPEALGGFDGLPEGLQGHIKALENPEEALRQNVWVWCESDDVEMEQLSPGLPFSFFPYRNQQGYLPPFVFVRILDIPAFQKVKVVCRAWASNIRHIINLRRTGEVRYFFEVLE